MPLCYIKFANVKTLFTDIDECQVTLNISCPQDCVNYEGGYVCRCRSGYKKNGTTCEGKTNFYIESPTDLLNNNFCKNYLYLVQFCLRDISLQVIKIICEYLDILQINNHVHHVYQINNHVYQGGI